MPYNRREAILLRILAVLETVEGVAEVDDEKSVFRNRGQVADEKRPAIVLLDGSLRLRSNTTPSGGRNRNFTDDGESGLLPGEYTLVPQIFVLLPLAPNSDNEGQGELLSVFEINILAALSVDDELWELLGGRGNGIMEYRAMDTDMQTGSSMEGQMQLDVAFTYSFDPDELTQEN